MSTVLNTAILRRIAAEEGLDIATMYIGERGAVFYRRDDQLLICCQVGTQYWLEMAAAIISDQVIDYAKREKTVDAYNMGKQACRDGQVVTANPFGFMAEGKNWSDWLTGFHSAASGFSK